MIDLELDERLFQSYTCSFRIIATDPKAEYLVEDAMLQFEGDQFFITDVIKEREENEAYHSIVAEAGWMRLADLKRPGSFTIDGLTAQAGLDSILNGTGWTCNQVTDSASTHSLEATDATVLELIWKWAKINGCEVQFETIPKTLVFIPQVGANRGLSFRHGRNLTRIKRTASAPKVTRLYAYGRNEIDVSSLNAGLPYVEDYSFYTAAGYTIDEARANYRKDEVWVDDSFIDVAALFAAAQTRLGTLSQPTLLYEASTIDLSEILDTVEGDFKTGDVVRVYDEILDINVEARVSRRVRYPHEPYKNKVELAFAPILLPDTSTSARSNTTKSWELFESRNRTTLKKIRQNSTIVHRLVLDTIDGAEWISGFKLQGVAVGDSTLTIEVTNDTDDSVVWTSFVEDLVDGQDVNYNFTFGEKDIPAGEYIMVIRAFSDTAGAGIDIAQGDTAYWYLARGTTRDGVTLANSVRYDFTGGIQYFDVPDDVTDIRIEAGGSSGSYNIGPGGPGGGGKVIANFTVVAGTRYRVYVGGRSDVSSTGSFPNGGRGMTANNQGAAGGGSSSVQPDTTTADPSAAFFETFPYALIVAPGGGGDGSGDLTTSDGGDGGFFAGSDATRRSDGTSLGGTGATQVAGGIGSTGFPSEGDGGFGYGGSGHAYGAAALSEGGGGGGGWYGGGAGGGYAGGGGSGWIADNGYDLEYEDGYNRFLYDPLPDNPPDNGYVIISWATPDSP